jgi:acyl-CoA thioester hydrolase
LSFIQPIRVYWEDTDAGGIVFYANYLKFFERARTEWLRSLGLSQHQLKTELGAMFVVSETHVKYLAPAVLDDLLEVHTVITEKGKSSITLEQKAYRAAPVVGNHLGDNYNSLRGAEPGKQAAHSQHQEGSGVGPSAQALCTGTIRIGWINVATGRPTRIPSFIQEVL